MKKGLPYNSERLKELVRQAGLSDAELAPLVGVKRNQIYKALNNRGASVALVCEIVKVVNQTSKRKAEESGQQHELIDWRTLFPMELALPEKNLAEIVS